MQVDAIVNTTNEEMVGYSGVDLAVHECAGPELDAECARIAPLGLGSAKITKGYNLNAKFPGFLQAEVYADGKVVAATGHNFIGFVDVERVQKVMRISSERGFSEVYNRKGSTMFKVPIEVIDAKIPLKLMETPIDNYKIVNPSVVKYKGTFLKEEKEIADRFNKKLESFKENEIEFKPIYDMYKMKYIKSESESKISYPYTLKKGEYIVFSMGENLSGFIRHKIKAIGNTKMIIGVTNDDYSGDFFPCENGNVNVIDYEMTGGEYEGETIESYGFEFLYVFAIEGEIEIDEVSVRKII